MRDDPGGQPAAADALSVPLAGAGVLRLPRTVLRGAAPGPHVAVLGAVHGDEYEGVVAAGALLRGLEREGAVRRGQVTVVPVANPPAYAAGTRVNPLDGLNLARTFPGDERGSPSERIAAVLSREVIRRADFLIDLHSAGQHYAMPLLCGAYSGDDAVGRASQAAALAFGAPVLWAHPTVNPGRSLSVAIDAGIPCLYAECGGGGRVRRADVDAYVSGVRRVLSHLGVLPPGPPPPPPAVRLRSDGNTDAALAVAHAGLLVSRAAPLDGVAPGDVLGEVLDETGAVLETLRAPAPGRVALVRRTARVRPGDGAYLIAAEAPPAGAVP
jgi:predicted deacylase